jgi:hypothetical protein
MAGVEGDRVTLDRELARLLANGEKISAIKLLRERQGMGLAEAKDVVDRAVAAIGAAAAGGVRVDVTVNGASPGARSPRVAALPKRALTAVIVVIAIGIGLWRALR